MVRILSIIKGIPAMMLAGILFSCVNDLDTIQRVTYDPKAPDEVMQNLEVLYNDSGYARIKIFSTFAETYHTPVNLIKFKDGIKVDFYDENGSVASSLTALYGEYNQDTRKIFVRDSVQLKNLVKEQLLETEELHWNQNDSTIYTDKNVLVTTPDKKGYGKGIRTNQEFSEYQILQPYGKFNPDRKRK